MKWAILYAATVRGGRERYLLPAPLLAHIDPEQRILGYVSEGHEAAFLVGNRTGRLLRLERTGTVMGLSGRMRYEPCLLFDRAIPWWPSRRPWANPSAAFAAAAAQVLFARRLQRHARRVERVLREDPRVPRAGLRFSALKLPSVSSFEWGAAPLRHPARAAGGSAFSFE